MTNQELARTFRSLGTAPIADATVRLGLEFRTGPAGLLPVTEGVRVAGRALPVRHAGSVDVFFEAMERAHEGDVLVIDNEGLTDEGCIGDLTVLEAVSAKIAALVVWGTHRDTRYLHEIGLPVWSLGRCPYGPRRARERDARALESARVGDVLVTASDLVFADEDGLVFVDAQHERDVLREAAIIVERERAQAELARTGTNLREQLQFATYLERRAKDPSLTFRAFLQEVAGAIET